MNLKIVVVGAALMLIGVGLTTCGKKDTPAPAPATVQAPVAAPVAKEATKAKPVAHTKPKHKAPERAPRRRQPVTVCTPWDQASCPPQR